MFQLHLREEVFKNGVLVGLGMSFLGCCCFFFFLEFFPFQM